MTLTFFKPDKALRMDFPPGAAPVPHDDLLMALEARFSSPNIFYAVKVGAVQCCVGRCWEARVTRSGGCRPRIPAAILLQPALDAPLAPLAAAVCRSWASSRACGCAPCASRRWTGARRAALGTAGRRHAGFPPAPDPVPFRT